jgi:F-type H+-transporting ATPase subunit b
MFDFNATLPVMALQFLLLAALLNAIFYKPLTKVLDERDNYIQGNKLSARERLDKAERLTKEYEQQLADARKQSQTVMASATEEAQKVYADQVAAAQKEAQGQREQASKEIERQKQEVMGSLEQQVDSLSQQILDKLLGANVV